MISWLRIALVGLLMGAAEVVPGVSGGTLAFVSGLYGRLLNAVQQFTPARLLELRDPGIPALWRQMDINFLLVLFGAMGVSIVLLARVIGYLLETYPVLVWAFFFGLVAASVWVVGRRLLPLTAEALACLVLGTMLGLLLVTLLPISLEATPYYLFLGGSIAVCAWILPGVSGSFILLLLGLYPAVLQAVRDLALLDLLYLGSGCAIGLVAFSRFLTYLLGRAYKPTLATLTGLMLGSLLKIWPWQYTTSYQMEADGSQKPLVQEPVLPHDFAELTGNEPWLGFALLAILLGAVVILLLDRLSLLTGGTQNAASNS